MRLFATRCAAVSDTVGDHLRLYTASEFGRSVRLPLGFLNRLLGKVTMKLVAEDALKELRSRGITIQRADSSAGEIDIEQEGSTTRISLGNLFHEYENTPRGARAALVKRFIGGLSTPPLKLATYAEAREVLMPVMRDAATFSISHLALVQLGGADAPRTPRKHLVADISVALVCDMPGSMAYVSQAQLDSWDVTFDAALEDALQNLRKLPEHGGWKDLDGGVRSGEWGDGYDSSRILLPDLLYRAGAKAPVVLVPFRDALLMTEATNIAGLEQMARTAEEVMGRNGRWLSFTPLELRGTQWVEHAVPNDLKERYAALRVHSDAAAYASQKDLLDVIHGANGTDIFIATYLTREQAGKAICGMAILSEGIDTLLPVVSRVALGFERDGKDEHLLVSWDRLVELAGARMELVPDLSPPRYRVRGFEDFASFTP